MVADHESKTLSGALGVTENQFEAIFEEVEAFYSKGGTVSLMIERCARRFQGSELALSLVILGIVHERTRRQED